MKVCPKFREELLQMQIYFDVTLLEHHVVVALLDKLCSMKEETCGFILPYVRLVCAFCMVNVIQ